MAVWRYTINQNQFLSATIIHQGDSQQAAGPAQRAQAQTHLHRLQVLQPLLHELLHPPGVLDALVLAKRISRPAPRILAEVVGRELAALAEELSVLLRADMFVSASGRQLETTLGPRPQILPLILSSTKPPTCQLRSGLCG